MCLPSKPASPTEDRLHYRDNALATLDTEGDKNQQWTNALLVFSGRAVHFRFHIQISVLMGHVFAIICLHELFSYELMMFNANG